MYALNKIFLTHYCNDLLNTVSKDIAKQAKYLSYNLRKITVFLPNQLSQSQFRDSILKEITKQGHDAVFPPVITSLRQWIHSKYVIKKPILSQYARELILVDAIKQQPDLFSNTNPWGVANELLSLFDEMLLNNIKPIEFNNYNQVENQDISQAFLHEYDLVNMLWTAWLNQISDENYVDPNQVYATALKEINVSSQDIFYCVGIDKLSKLEYEFLNRAEKKSKLLFFAYASNPDCSTRADVWLKKYLDSNTKCDFNQNSESSPYSTLLDEVFTNNSLGIKQRAEAFAKNNLDPLSQRLSIYKSNSFEKHTKAIDVQIRIWINENKQKIGVVTTDRKLARRLRAVLEHANIAVNDAAGWALTTTSAAVVIEWWLQLVEGRHPAKQLIALVNSPFYPESNSDIHKQAINFLEKEIILRLNLHDGIHRYRSAIEKVQEKNKAVDPSIFDYLIELLDKLEASIQLLGKLHGLKSYPLHQFINGLLNSLKPIGIYTSLSNDDAGKQIIDLFENQIAHFKLIDNNLSWPESRRFMSRILDQQNYKPPTSKTSVTFCSLDQSRLKKFDALIIASVDKNHFPGTGSNYLFFNEQVRTELNISTWRDEHAVHLHQFRSLLDSAEKILITAQTERNGEKTTPSPWLEAIEMFYFMAYKNNLTDSNLDSLVDLDDTSIKQISDIPLPAQYTQPSPVLIPELQPDSISISQYQSLVDCPYQYFSLSCLKISQTKELMEELCKADFGSLVHQSIHVFFTHLSSLPGPFANKVTTHNRIEAEELLQKISKKVFSQSSDIEPTEGFNNQLWLQRWLNLIPYFIDWEINRQLNYTPLSQELSISCNVDGSSKIHGRIDRVDKSKNGFSIIDYKTGFTPTKKSIIAGEEVQLPMYALLNESHTNEKTNQVEYVAIGPNTVKSTVVIKDNELNDLKREHLHRLKSFFNKIKQNTPLIALAENNTCERCDAFGICRKSFWDC